ncbi:hypothetical protein J5X84_39405 [Streptosporangiaceae bacterium NEAU-GS5]|nr:hypothetical protein [Streptosporangiaceae bacterium NEAU-GS5]
MALAETAGIAIEVVGISATFDEPRAYAGETSDWVMAPAEDDPHLASGAWPIPGDQRRRLEQLVAAGVRFDRLYIAHEVPRGRIELPLAPAELSTGTEVVAIRPGQVLAPEVARQAVGPVPVPVPTAALALAERLGQIADLPWRVVAGARDMVNAAIAVRNDFDPMVLGVITARRTAPTPALGAFCVLAQWI